jgi:Phage capsid family
MPPAALTARDELQLAHRRMTAIIARARDADRDLTDEERQEADALHAKMEKLAQKVHRDASFNDLLAGLNSTAISAGLGASPGQRSAPGDTLGGAITQSAGYQALRGALPGEGPHRAVFDIQAALTGTSFCAPVQMPAPPPGPAAAPVAPMAVRLRVNQLLPHIATDSGAVSYLQITSKATGAAVVPIGTLKPAFTLNGQFLEGKLVTIAATLVVDDAQLEDADGLRATLDAELASGIADSLDAEILTGTGTGGRWLGLLLGATGTPYAVVAGQSPLDAILAASAALEDASGRAPDGIVMNATTYAASLAVKATGSGMPLVPPTPYPALVFPGTNLRLALNAAVANGEALLGSYWLGAKLDSKRDVRIEISNSVSDSFLKNQSVIRAELRTFLAITRPHAFGTITGLPGGA